MSLEVGDIGSIKFGDGTTARVKIIQIDRHSYVPTDYWFQYLEGETNRQLSYHEMIDIFPDGFPLPEGLVAWFFTKDADAVLPEVDEYEQMLQGYLDKNMNPEDHEKGRDLFARLERLMTRADIIRDYFNI